MDLRELRAFLVVAAELSFRRAAERLHMSQPPLSRLIAGLERDLRVRLLDRSTRSVSLTAAGALLFREGPAVLERAEALESRVRERGRRSGQPLRIGLSTAGFATWVPERIARFEAQGEGRGVELTSNVPDRLLRDLQLGRLDAVCAEMADEEAPGLERWVVAEDAIGVLLPATHRLARRRALRLRDLEGETFVVHPRHEHAHLYESQQRALRAAGIRYRIVTKRPDESCPILVARGKGLLLAAPSFVRTRASNTRFLPLREPALTHRVALLWRGERASPELTALLDSLRRGAPRRGVARSR
ncbi:transcriptional regulator, LysR family [Anaeromyxobacter dehalogenans 2CP-1]|uniref:Transcriptional regulator, LysR family n=1 Tax=Anaeromyxobacter dehalogenans (strain ATCC BAA-258 / DSM 21875 / 2CP-1) TaxID=455488 RepID=B8JF86_ANAD2|nr:LysR substrate-binding domain-containing protein [Anaeromyxobacter dehalogenans]ACL64443.1 transcriptional regulator, LysR family [Anaeromyxobacter dehalogenans 2CP-1]